MAFFKRKDMLSIFQRKHEIYLFQLVMDEIANNGRKKGIWGQAIVKSNGDEKKAEAEYIKLRVESLKDELEIQKQEETDRQIIEEGFQNLAKEEQEKQIKLEKEEQEEKIKIEKDKSFDSFIIKFLGVLMIVISLMIYLN